MTLNLLTSRAILPGAQISSFDIVNVNSGLHRRRQGVTPRAVKNFLGIIYRGNLSAPPDRARVNFYDIFAGRVRFGGLFSSFRPPSEGDD